MAQIQHVAVVSAEGLCAGGSVLPPHTDGEAIPTGCVVHPTPFHVLAARLQVHVSPVGVHFQVMMLVAYNLVAADCSRPVCPDKLHGRLM